MPWKKEKSAETATLEKLIDMLNISGVSQDKLSEVTYFACLKILSESIGKLPLKLMKQNKNGGVEKLYDNFLYSIVGVRPNPYMTATTFWGTVEYNRNHYGNGYVWIRRRKKDVQLWILKSSNVVIFIDNAAIWGERNAVWYIYNDGQKSLKLSSDEVLHFKTSHSFDGIVGLSVKEQLDSTLTGNIKAQAMLNKAYENGFTGKAVLQYTANLNDVNEKAYTKKIEEFVKNQDDNIIIPMMLGTQLTPVNTKLADNQFMELKKYSALQIAAAFGIKPNQINDYEKASYASAEAQQLAFYVDTLLYILKQYEEEITGKLLSHDEIKQGMYFKFNVAVILRADLKTQIESLVRAVQGGIKTPNEARSMLDLPQKEGGDKLICNGSMIPVEMAGVQYQKQDNME